ncbi:MAG: aspartate kinase [Clostridiales bacterium]|nr:aspartate kinase [Clostridiales bacterium]
MGIKVAKFGGSSLADVEQFKKVGSIVMMDEERRYIVPSAPGKRHSSDHKITDLLYLCQEHAQKGVPFGEVFELISTRYLEIVEGLGLSLDLEPILEDIREKILGGYSAEYTASRGEYLNGIILAEFLGYEFVDPADMIFFTQAGAYDAQATKEAVREALSEVERAVIPGFYGSRPDGGIQTFSRGGSDITGAIIAQGVGADLYENWTDVSGFMMADPRIVNNPKPIKEITYKELRELAYMGANVLHEESVFPVRQAGIPINIKNTNDPEAVGTLIVPNGGDSQGNGMITGVAGKKGFTIISIEKAMMNAELGFGRKLLSIIESHGISFEHMPSGIDNISLVIADNELEGKLEEVLEDINQQLKPDSVDVHSSMALVATVGMGMARTPGISGKLFGALGDENINVRMIAQGSGEMNIIIGVENEDFERAIQTIYFAFVE